MSWLDRPFSVITRRPCRFGRVRVPEGKWLGACHVVNWQDTQAESVTKIGLAKTAGITATRVMFEPWMFDSSGRVANRVAWQVAYLIDAKITPVIELLPGTRDELTHVAAWRKFVHATVAYLPRVTHFGIMNEPDNQPIWEPARYAFYLAVAAEEIKSLRPSAKVLAPELGMGKERDLDEMLDALNPERIDVVTAHIYGDHERARKVVAYAKGVGKPVWFTEFGSKHWLGQGVRAAHVRADIEQLLGMDNVQGGFVYALYDPGEKMKPYNLLDDDLQPNAVYRAVSEAKH